MKVSELIAALSQMPPDAEAECDNEEGSGQRMTITRCTLERDTAVIGFSGYGLSYEERVYD